MWETFTNWITNSTLGEVVSDTLIGSASGAIIGGATAALTGGEFKDGAKTGAIAGAVIGGGSSIYDNWGELTNNTTVTDKLNTMNKINEVTPSAATGGLLDDVGGSNFLASNDTSLAANDGFKLDIPESSLFSDTTNTALNLQNNTDSGFINSLKSGMSNMTPAQGKFYGEILKGLGAGIMSMEEAKEAKKAADLQYERTKRKIQPGLLGSLTNSPVPQVRRT